MLRNLMVATGSGRWKWRVVLVEDSQQPQHDQSFNCERGSVTVYNDNNNLVVNESKSKSECQRVEVDKVRLVARYCGGEDLGVGESRARAAYPE